MARQLGAWTADMVKAGLADFIWTITSASCSRARRGGSRSMAAGWAKL
jgi:hypothetical protein